MKHLLTGQTMFEDDQIFGRKDSEYDDYRCNDSPDNIEFNTKDKNFETHVNKADLALE